MEPDQRTNKLKVGWFTFTCCEDSTILFTELLNDHFFEWKEKIDFVHMKVLKSKNTLTDMDVAFVEGAITSEIQAEKLKKIRQLAKKLIAIGACAVTGQPSGLRNAFDQNTRRDISPVLERFRYADTVRRLDELVTVDQVVPGCPMDADKFLALMNQLLTGESPSQ